ncbi:MAG TPA: DUF2339 domain-containing protein, partial [Candidatus Hydrogenedentes bacterium]|nr:DUF2339 domain-containing protein [Candidatus Hydrogenedentota bacterium]
FTGGGLAIFYLCIFFAFQVYHLTGAGIAMLFAVFVTLLAVSLSVLHNAVPIAMLAVLGGYLSPVFLSTGENAPWTLFTYVAALNLVALGAGYFRRWRLLDLLCLAGTAALYLAWYDKYYAYPDQMAPALTFTTVFYLMFLIAPVLYSLVRGVPEGLQSLTLIIGNSLFWLFCYYSILFKEHQFSLGLVALMQALLVFLLYNLWMRRVREPTPTGQSLLVISMSLLTLVVPLWLRFYTIPIAWAAEGVVLLWLSFRFRNELTRLGGIIALTLSGGGLLYYLPLHSAPFVPIFNGSFGAWLFVILAVVCGAGVVNRHRKANKDFFEPLAGVMALAALIMLCFLLTVETFQYWELRRDDGWFVNASMSLMLLWTIIPLPLLWFTVAQRNTAAAWIMQGLYAFSLLVFVFSIGGIEHDSRWLLFNLFFLPRLFFVIFMWWGVARLKDIVLARRSITLIGLELAGHAVLALLCFSELIRWGRETTLIDADMALGIVSAVWALHACALIWHGLITRIPARRYAGFALFALTTAKTVLIDVFELAAVYRIVSWLGVGFLLVVAALLYQRYSVLFSADAHTPPADDENDPNPSV